MGLPARVQATAARGFAGTVSLDSIMNIGPFELIFLLAGVAILTGIVVLVIRTLAKR